MNYIREYHEKMQDGSVCVGKWIRLLYDQLISGMDSGEYCFDEDKAEDAVGWIEEHCFHTEGPLAPGRLKLELWQKALVSAMFGIVDPETGYRRFREVVLVVARKNGKSLLGSGIANFTFRKDGGYGARVYNIAPKLDQADIIYSNTWAMVQLDPEWQDLKAEIEASGDGHTKRSKDDSMLVKKRQTDMYIAGTNSTMKKIAFSAKKSDGFNPSLCICDEIASWGGDDGLKQYEVMKSGMGARPEAILFSCSTSGYINDSIYDELIKRSTRFLLGDSKEKRLLPFLYMIDDLERWNDMDELRKSNPNLGISVSEDYLTEEIAVAEGSLSKKSEFITKYCNLKQNSSLAWLPTNVVDAACGEHLNLEDFSGCYCVSGIDLSMTTDLTACVVVIEKDGILNVFCRFWLPQEKIEEATARDGLPYSAYIKRGILFPSGNNIVDYNDCENFLKELVEKYRIYPLKVGYDRYSAQYLVQDLENYGFHMDDVYQGRNLSPVIYEVDGLLRDGRVRIGDNDLLKIHLLNSALKQDVETQKVRLVKLNPNDHIDGVAALLDAMCVRQKWFGEIGGSLRNED